MARGPAEVEQIAEELLGMQLVTHQTEPEGRKVSRLLVEEGLEIERELYLGEVLDRVAACPVMMASTAGGRGGSRKPNNVRSRTRSNRKRPTMEQCR